VGRGISGLPGGEGEQRGGCGHVAEKEGRIKSAKVAGGGFRLPSHTPRCERGFSRRPVWLYMAKWQFSGTIAWLGVASRRPVTGDGGSPNGSLSARAELGDLGHIAVGLAECLAPRESALSPAQPCGSAANGPGRNRTWTAGPN
jgi:hypothetical protein